MGATKQTIAEEAQTRYETAFAALANRCLGEPYGFHIVAPLLAPGLLESDLQSAKVVFACLSQHTKNGSYTPQSIALEYGMHPSEALKMAQLDSEMSLQDAMEAFLLYHGQWAEIRVAGFTEAWVMKGMSSEEIQAEAAKARKAMGLCARLAASDGKDEFEKKLLAAIDGIRYEYPVTPYLADMRRVVPYYEPGDYIVTAALTGQGKSYDVLNQILHNAKSGIPSAYINLENTPVNVQKRLWQMERGERFRADLSGTDHEMREHLAAWERVKKYPVFSYNPGRSLTAIVSTIRQAWYEHGIQFAGIDYAQLVNIAGYKGNRNYELGEVSGTLRALALELQIPIYALAQLKQEVAKTGEKRGGMYDIKDCADFSQDATIVKILYRPGYFDIHDFELPGGGREPYPDGYADHFIAKGRETGPELVKCRFDPVRGFYDVPEPTQFPSAQPFDGNTITAARPMNDQDIPF